MIGQQYSYSPNCGIIRFVGGPYDGQSGMWDHDRYNAIAFCNTEHRVTHEYVPAGRFLYRFSRSYGWGREKTDFELSI